MRPVTTLSTIAAGAATCLLFLGVAPVSAEAEAVPSPCPSSSDLTAASVPEGTDVEACDLVGDLVELDGGLEAQIPEPGVTLTVEAYYADGAELASISVDDDGTIAYGDDDVAAGHRLAASAPSACSDGAYNDGDEEQAGRWNWWLGDGARPAGFTTAQALDALQDALTWISEGHNDCGITPGYSEYAVSAYYNGGSSLESDFHLNGDGKSVCGDGSTDGRDGKSVVDFGNLDNPGHTTPLATECTWTLPQPFNKNNILESDIRFNITDKSFYNAKPSSCSNRFDLRGVAIHEFGHSFGLGHVSETDHGNLTMSTEVDDCDNSQRTLGKGDLAGLKKIYG